MPSSSAPLEEKEELLLELDLDEMLAHLNERQLKHDSEKLF